MKRGSLAKIRDDTNFYPHQIEGVRTMQQISSFLLADEMGLGKSLQALTVAAIDFELGHAKRVLIVAPVTLKWNWEDEIEKFTNFRCLVLEGGPVARDMILNRFEFLNYEILIVNYEQVVNHVGDFNALDFDIIIWDEAHYLKNPNAKRSRASLHLKSKRSFLLTGSPLLNKVDELYSIMHRIAPHVYGDHNQFRRRYCVFGGYEGKTVVGVKNRLELQANLEQVMIRRLKKDVLDLPEKQYISIKVDLTPQQKELYDQVHDDLLLHMPDEPEPTEIENALTRFLRLKEICGTTFKFTGEDHSSKLDRAVDMAEEIIDNGEHLVIFTQFRAVGKCLEDRLDAVGVEHFTLNGDVPSKTRSELVKRWTDYRDSQGRPTVLVAGLQVSGVGLTMTAASKCIFVDKLFVPKLNEQAEDRLHRIGADETKPIQIFEILCKGTIESRIETILRQKKKLFDTLIEDNSWKQALYDSFREDAIDL